MSENWILKPGEVESETSEFSGKGEKTEKKQRNSLKKWLLSFHEFFAAFSGLPEFWLLLVWIGIFIPVNLVS